MRPGISYSAIPISRRPRSASWMSLTTNLGLCDLPSIDTFPVVAVQVETANDQRPRLCGFRGQATRKPRIARKHGQKSRLPLTLDLCPLKSGPSRKQTMRYDRHNRGTGQLPVSPGEGAELDSHQVAFPGILGANLGADVRRRLLCPLAERHPKRCRRTPGRAARLCGLAGIQRHWRYPPPRGESLR